MYAPNSNGIISDTLRAVSPELAYRIGQYFKENKLKNEIDGGNRPEEQSPQHLLAHTILGAAVSYATGNNPTIGALSAVGSEAVAPVLSNYLYGKKPNELSQDEKDTITSILSLTTVATAYTVTDGNVAGSVSAGEIGRVGVEWNKNRNSLHASIAINNEKCRNGDVKACEIRTLGDILGGYVDKYHDLTIYSVSGGVFSYTIIVNNKNDTVWVGGLPESDDVNNYRSGVGLSLNPKDVFNKIQQDAKSGKIRKIQSVGASVQVGNVLGRDKADDIDKAISGRSLGVQACNIGCLGISKGEKKDGAVIITTGVGTTQIGIGGTVMRQLTQNEKKQLQDLGILP
ncbi:VENN motif pre-toxin domain-containing protein [Moraxella cuniculi]|uniref:Uncharacterized protein n=1 Tax=Moraxella cuniculi TaxID=34061 RepID=A0A3S4UM49_9GAMM|nr:VENN motif pre-toxin domain-containing protein [Moraxella cuniculi]VEG13955.1 Uncharacterised protein [Moraxella cuniculi]